MCVPIYEEASLIEFPSSACHWEEDIKTQLFEIILLAVHAVDTNKSNK